MSMENTIPLLDNLVEYLKSIMLNCTIKNPKMVNKYEDGISTTMASQYMAAIKGTATFDSFKYTYVDFVDALSDVLNVHEVIDLYNSDWKTIPENYRKKIFQYYRNKILEEYEEGNEYYRALNGKPNIMRTNAVYVTEEEIGDIKGVDINLPVHQMTAIMQDTLYSFKIIDMLINRTGYKYLNYLGSRSISIYELRTAPDYALLGIETSVPNELLVRFKEKYEINRKYTLKVINSDAFAMESDHYEEFIILCILIQTACDILNEIPDIINNREIFDLKTIKLFFKSYGMGYFADIPYKYQLLLVKNFHRILSNKSTNQSIIDILRIFGMKNINLYNYNLMKVRKMLDDGSYSNTGVEEYDFELKFLKFPVDKNHDEYIHDEDNFIDYYEIVSNDIYWDGDYAYNENYESHLSEEFNYIRSKYLSIDILNDINEMNNQLIYFYNILFDEFIEEDVLTLSIPYLSVNHFFRLSDIFTFLTALAYEYNGLEDNLLKFTDQQLYVKGFNFKTDMNEIVEMLNNNEMIWDDLGIREFIKFGNGITFDDVVKLLNNNILTLEGIIKLMNNAENKKMYDIYNKIYESLFIMELNDKFYVNTIGYYPDTHTEFLSNRDAILYNHLLKIKEITDEESKEEQISTLIEYIVNALETNINLDFTYIFKDIPTVSMEAIQNYIIQVINYYKSFKTQILSINSKLNFNDKLDNKINILCDFNYNVDNNFTDYSKDNFIDNSVIYSKLLKNEPLEIKEKMYIEYILGKYYQKYYKEKLLMKDKLEVMTYLHLTDNIEIHDSSVKIEEVI